MRFGHFGANDLRILSTMEVNGVGNPELSSKPNESRTQGAITYDVILGVRKLRPDARECAQGFFETLLFHEARHGQDLDWSCRGFAFGERELVERHTERNHR